ncbi:MAG: amidohydrolase family protein [Pseudomonadota bacterium]
MKSPAIFSVVKRASVIGLTVVAATVSFIGAAQAEVTALVGATLYPVDQAPIDNGTLIMREGRIESLGADIEIPADADVVQLNGQHIYPGFIHPGSKLGLTEMGSVAGTVDFTEMGSINPAIRVEVAFNHDSALLPVNIAGGILTTHTVPAGGLIRGTSAVMNMDGWSWQDMIIRAPAAMHIAFPTAAADDRDNDDLQLINRAIGAARQWQQANDAASSGNGQAPLHNDALAALVPLLNGDIPLFLYATRQKEIEAALDWAQEQAFDNLVIVGGPDLQYVVQRLAADNIPVVLNGVYTMPTRRWDAYDQAYVAAAKLHEAGVPFAIGDGGGGFNATNARNLPFHAGSAAAFGLPKDIALRSVTLSVAEILGIDDELGSLTVGKRASLIVTNGDPLEPMTRIERVWIDGEEYDLSRNRHQQLYERYRDRIAEQQGS